MTSDQATATATPETNPTNPTNPTAPKPRSRGTERREVMVPLSKAELRARGREMARCELESIALGRELEGIKTQARLVKARIDDLADARGRLAKVIDEKQEARRVECEWFEALRENAWHLIRKDTGERIDVEPMKASERQLSLDGVEAVAEAVAEAPEPAKGKRGRKSNGKATKHKH